MLRNLLNKALGSSEAKPGADQLRQRLTELRETETQILRRSQDASRVAATAMKDLREAEDAHVSGNLDAKELSRIREEAAEAQQAVLALRVELKDHQNLFARATELLQEAERIERAAANAGLEAEIRIALVEFAEDMAEFYMASLRIAEIRRKANDSGVSDSLAEAAGAKWGELSNLHAILSRLQLIEAACGPLPESALALMQTARIAERDQAAAEKLQRTVENNAHQRRMRALNPSQAMAFDFSSLDAQQLAAAEKEVASADLSKLCADCAAEGRVREGNKRKITDEFGTKTTVKCAEHSHAVVSA